MNRTRSRVRPTLFALLPLCAACDGDGRGGTDNPAEPTPRDPVADVLIADLPVDELSSFRTVVVDVRLQRDTGTRTENLVGGDISVELLGLGDDARWLTSASLEPGATFDALTVEFDAAGYEARDLFGQPVAVAAVTDTLMLDLATPVTVEEEGYIRFEIDLDLGQSLTGDVADGAVVFDPAGGVVTSDGATPTNIDEIEGLPRSFDEAERTVTVDGFADGDLDVPLGPVRAEILDGALLFGEDDELFGGPEAFFGSLVVDQTVLEIHGQLGADGVVRTGRVEIEDRPVGGDDDGVRIEGRVIAQTAAGFDMQVIEIEKGESIAEPVLAELDDAGTIAVDVTSQTLFVEDDGTPTTDDALAVGQELKVRFATFDTEPFPAARIEIEDAQPEFEGTVIDVSDLPDRMFMILHPASPAIAAGLVADATTAVEVLLGDAGVELDTSDDPTLAAADLLEQMRVRARGSITGSPLAPQVDASRVVVRAGRLDEARIVEIAPADGFFETVGGELEDPFGGGIVAGPMRVVIDEQAEIDGDASSIADLFDTVEGLAPDEFAEVRIEGIATGGLNEIRAFEIDLRVESD